MLDDSWAVIGIYFMLIGGFGVVVSLIRYFAERAAAKHKDDDPYDF